MHALFERLRPAIRWVMRHPYAVVLVALLLSLLGGWYSANNFRLDTDLANLLPSDYPSVQALDELRETLGGERGAQVAIWNRNADGAEAFEVNKAFAEALVPVVLAMEHNGEAMFTRAELRREIGFLQRNALYFATDGELEELTWYLEDLQEQARLEANPFYVDLGDDFDDEEADDEPDAAANMEASYERIVGREYQVSADSAGLLVTFFPSSSQTNVRSLQRVYDRLDEAIAQVDPSAYGDGLEVTSAGWLYRSLEEVGAIQTDVQGSFGAGVLAVLLAVIFYFFYKAYRARAGSRFDAGVLIRTLIRAPALGLVIALPLMMSLTWTGGIAFLAFDALNLMTSTLALVLFGLGVDYGIHFYARYTEERARGLDVVDAGEETFLSTAQAITIGALSTSAALFVLTFADFKGFSEFGVIAGIGILFALVSMTVVLPAMLAVFERWHLVSFDAGDGAEAPTRTSSAPARAYKPKVIASLVAVVAAVAFVGTLSFEYDFASLEPSYPGFEERNAPVYEVTDSQQKAEETSGDQPRRRNPAYVITQTPEQSAAVVAAYEAIQEADTTSPTILDVESLQQRFPSDSDAQDARLEQIAYVRELLDDPFLTAEPNADLDRLRMAAGTTDPVELEDIPEALRAQYTTKTGEIGNFVMVYPSVGLSDGRNSIAFSDDVGRVETADGDVFYAGSTSLVAADMLRLMMSEAPWMVLGTFLIVVLLMVLNFRSLKWAMLAIIPLVVGLLWMILGMEILGLKLNFYNLVVLPAILGIGNDAGVHIVHRYREEGPGSLRYILKSTGEHVFMSSLTTMIGFGGLLLSFHPGLKSIGQLAVLGIGTTVLAALVFLPALLQWLESRETPVEAIATQPHAD